MDVEARLIARSIQLVGSLISGLKAVPISILQISMPGRIKLKQQIQQIEQAQRASQTVEQTCALCYRALGSRVEWHHPVPKSEGGNVTVPVHPICHRAIHAHVSNHDLAAQYADLDDLRAREDIQRFLRWIRNKPADFHAPTRHNRER